MLINNIINNTTIPNPSYSGVYQEKYEKGDLYQGINMFWVGSKLKKNCRNYGERYSCNIQHKKNQYPTTFKKGEWESWAYR